VFMLSFYVPTNTTVCTSTSLQFRRAGQQGPTRKLTAALRRLLKQLLGTYSTTQVKYYKQTRKLEKSTFSVLFLKTYKDVKFTVDVSAFQTLCCCFCVPIRFLVDTSSWSRQLPTLVMFQSGKEQRRRPVVDSKGRVLAKFIFNLVSLFSVHTAILLFS